MRVLVAYDGSPAAIAAIEIGARLLPSGADAVVAHLWTPPFASLPLRQRLHAVARTASELADLLEQEGAQEADRLVATGVLLAEAAGWSAEPVVRRSFGGDGYRFASLSEELSADVVLAGTRGLGAPGAVLDSFTDLLVHHSPRPVLVVPHPLLADARDGAVSGSVALGWDGSAGARVAAQAAAELFPDRDVVAISVGTESPEAAGGAAPKMVTVPEPVPVPARGRAIARALVEAGQLHGAGVIVVGSRGRSALRELLLGSTAMAVLHHAHLPVLVVPHGYGDDERGATVEGRA